MPGCVTKAEYSTPGCRVLATSKKQKVILQCAALETSKEKITFCFFLEVARTLGWEAECLIGCVSKAEFQGLLIQTEVITNVPFIIRSKGAPATRCAISTHDTAHMRPFIGQSIHLWKLDPPTLGVPLTLGVPPTLGVHPPPTLGPHSLQRGNKVGQYSIDHFGTQ